MALGGTGFSTIEICRLMELVDEYDRVIGDTQDPDWKPLPPITEFELAKLKRLGRQKARAAARDILRRR